MNSKLVIISIVLSLVAIGLSCYSLTNQYYADIPTTVLSLVGVCVTIVVGINLVEAISLHSMLNTYDKRMEELTKKTNDVSLMEGQMRKMKKQTNILFHYTWGLSYGNDGSYYNSLSEFWKAFLLAAETNDFKRAKSCLSNMEITIEIIEQQTLNDMIEEREFPYNIPEVIKGSDVYCVFGEKVDDLFLRIKSLNKVSNNNN